MPTSAPRRMSFIPLGTVIALLAILAVATFAMTFEPVRDAYQVHFLIEGISAFMCL